MIEIGSRVRYIRVDNEDDKATGYYPPIGTLGTVVGNDGYCYQVNWDSGTKGNGIYWCDHTDVEEELK